MRNVDLLVPEDDNEEHMHKALKFLSSFFGVTLDGSLGLSANISEVLGLLVKSPMERRLNKWRNEVVKTLYSLLNEVASLKPKNLINDEEFLSLFLSLTEIASRTHQEEKIKVLGMVLKNSYHVRDINFDLKHLLLRYIKELTIEELKILKLISENEVELRDVNSIIGFYEKFKNKLKGLIYTEFRIYLIELKNKGLLSMSNMVTDINEGVQESVSLVSNENFNEGAPFITPTNAGNTLLNFIYNETQSMR